MHSWLLTPVEEPNCLLKQGLELRYLLTDTSWLQILSHVGRIEELALQRLLSIARAVFFLSNV